MSYRVFTYYEDFQRAVEKSESCKENLERKIPQERFSYKNVTKKST